jgi:hypothetical protein
MAPGIPMIDLFADALAPPQVVSSVAAEKTSINLDHAVDGLNGAIRKLRHNSRRPRKTEIIRLWESIRLMAASDPLQMSNLDRLSPNQEYMNDTSCWIYSEFV